ncbi:MAG: zinc ABC transporter substrate-binding protein [bacterium]|nr:zinc ABC transporter substrate-binding protein [bacterium]
MNLSKISIALIGILALALSLIGKVVPNRISRNTREEKLEISVSFYPLAYIVSQIAGDKAHVITITPAGAEPHDYEPSTRDIARIEQSDLLILNGVGLEAWGEKILSNLKNKDTEVIVAADGLEIHTLDPHIWLDPVLANTVAANIARALIEIDPTNRSYYEKNQQNLGSELDSLDRAFREELSQCLKKYIVTSHAAFGYIASRYGLEQISLSGLSPDQEPSPRELASVVEFTKTHDISYIFIEPLMNARLSETIAHEVGAKTLVFNPLEGLTREEESAGKTYLTIQRENLENLKIALECR